MRSYGSSTWMFNEQIRVNKYNTTAVMLTNTRLISLQITRLREIS